MRILILFIAIFSFASEHLIFSKFENLKPYYYNHQIVNLLLKTISAKNGNILIKASYPIEVNTTTEDNITYFSKISFELNNTFPTFIVSLEDDGFLFDSLQIDINSQIRNLTPPKNFSGILADDVKIKNPILVPYDDIYNMIYFDISFKNANVKDFHFGKTMNFSLKDKNSSTYLYSALVDKNQKNFDILYFNTKTNSYDKIKLNVKLNNEHISTQIDLNPIKKSKLYLIDIALALVVLLNLFLFFYHRKKIYVFIILISTLILAILNWPKPEITLHKGMKVHVLPFEHSTVFMIIDKNVKAQVLYTKNGYKEIEFNNKIGWVKDEKN